MSTLSEIYWAEALRAGDLPAVAEACETVEKCLRRKRQNVTVQIDGESLAIPTTALRLLGGILWELAQGGAVAVVGVSAELTTQQAAAILNISRPHLVEKLESGAIPHRKVGKHRRIRFTDLVSYRATLQKEE
jgi:excisionase family DNA binding protein